MDWRLSAAWGVAAAGCIGHPTLVDCDEEPEHELCVSGSGTTMSTSSPVTISTSATTTEPTTTAPSSTSPTSTTTLPTTTTSPTDTDPSTTTQSIPLPDPGVCWRPLSPLTRTDEAPLTTIGNDNWEISFDADENEMPSRLRAPELNNQNLLFTGGDPTERIMAVQLWPDHFSYQYADGAAPILYVIADGEAVGRVFVDWDSTSLGVGIASSNGAFSDYLFTPDGRMIRSESPSVTSGLNPSLWFTVVTTLNANRFTRVEWFGPDVPDGEYTLGATTPVTIFPANHDVQANLDSVGFCAYNEDNGLAVSFGGDPFRSGSDICGEHPPIPPDSRPWGFRATHNSGTGGETVALQFDFGRSYIPGPTFYRSFTMGMVSVFPGDDPCECARAQFDAYINPPTMHAAPGNLTMEIPFTQEGEADNDGYFEQGGYYAIIPTADTFTVTIDDRSVPTVLLRITDIGPYKSTEGITARLDGAELTPGVDFVAQVDVDTQNDGYWFWLGRELPPDTPLEITH